MSLLSVRNLSVTLGPVRAVGGVSFELQRGETLALVGESGSGKSMTALALMGLTPRGAEVRSDRLALASGAHPRTVRGDRVAMVFQEPMTALNPVYTIGDQLMAVYRRHRGGHGEDGRAPGHTTAGDDAATGQHGATGRGGARARALDLLARVGVPEPVARMAQYPHQMSGGQRQRVLIAMALMCGPDLLIADEPTTALDVTTQARLLDLLADLQAEFGLAMLFISHDLGVVARVADRVAVMKDGVFVEEGAVQRVLTAPTHPYTAKLIESLPQPVPPRTADTPVLLRAEGIHRRYSGGGVFRRTSYHALKGISLTLHRGETLGIVGESGCGKSTLARILIGLDRPDEGAMSLDGTALSDLTQRARARRIQPVFQDPAGSLNPAWSIAQILDLPLRLHSDLDARGRAARVAGLLADVGLPERAAAARPRALSGGQRQRVAIARALAADPDILVCDEPTSALDVSVQAQILTLLRDLRARRGLSMVFISHDLAVVEAICDRVAVMHAGEIVEEGPADRVFAAPQHPQTHALKASILSIDTTLRRNAPAAQ